MVLTSFKIQITVVTVKTKFIKRFSNDLRVNTMLNTDREM